MRSLIYFDLNPSDKSDSDYRAYLTEELPNRLSLLAAEYAGIPWTATFADEAYGDETLDDFSATLRRHRDDYDVAIIVPNGKHIEAQAGLTQSSVTAQPYFKRLQDIVLSAGDLPVVSYVDEPGPRVEFNLLTLGMAAVVDQTDEPALLPLKIARAVNKGDMADELVLGAMKIDMKTGQVFVDGQSANLTLTERSLVLGLARARGRVRSKEQILRSIYTPEMDEPEIKIIDVFMTKIRGKINERRSGLGFDAFRTSWGDGYFLSKDIPANRVHRGLLRLDPSPEGGYVIADTSITVTDTEFDMFEYMYKAVGRGVGDGDNYLLSNIETLESLNRTLSSYLVAAGTPVLFDPEEGRTFLNPEYFDTALFDAGKFNSLLRQEIKSVGSYRFIRQLGSHAYRLGESDVLFSVPEVRMLENLLQVEGQAVRAHSLYRQIRGESHQARGLMSPDEDMIALARGLYKKLLQINTVEDAERNIHIYHDAYISFGPAEEIPDPEKISAARRMEIGERLIQRLAAATGTPVELLTYDAGLFTMKIHPVLGGGIIESHGVDLTARQVKILRTLRDARPEIVTPRALHEAAYPGREFSGQRLSTEIFHLRRQLEGVDAQWGVLLTRVSNKGYVSLMPGEPVPGDEPAAAPALTPDETWTTHDLGLFTLRVHPQGEMSVIDGRNQALNRVHTSILQALHAERSKQEGDALLVSEADLYRAAYPGRGFVAGTLTPEVNRLRTTLKFHDPLWAACLVTVRGRGYALLRDAADRLFEDVATLQAAAPAQILVPDETWETCDLGHFRLRIQPETGFSVIDGADRNLSALQTGILRTLHAHRAQQQGDATPMAETDLHRAIMAEQAYNPGTLKAEVNRLRNILKYHDDAWGTALVTVRGRGFALLSGEDDRMFEDAPVQAASALAPDETWHKHDLGLFTLLEHPDTGIAVIDGHNQSLNALQTGILKVLHAQRAGQEGDARPVSEMDLHRAVMPEQEFEPGALSYDINRLRNTLKYHDATWAACLVTQRLKGFALLRGADDKMHEDPAATAAPAQRRAAAPVEPPEEITLVGGLVLLRDVKTGKAQVQHTDHVLAPNEVTFLELLSSRYPETVFFEEVQRTLKLANGKQFADGFEKRWSIHCEGVMSPYERAMSNRGCVWTLRPGSDRTQEAELGSTGDFAFGPLSGGMAECAHTGLTFTVREVELLSLLQERRGTPLGLMAVVKTSKLSWKEELVLQTLAGAQAKIARKNPGLAGRLQFSKPSQRMQLAAPMRRLPQPRPSAMGS